MPLSCILPTNSLLKNIKCGYNNILFYKDHKTPEKEDEMLDCSSAEENNVENLENSSNCVSQKNKSFWSDELRLFQTLGLDKLALASCKRTDLEPSRKE